KPPVSESNDGGGLVFKDYHDAFQPAPKPARAASDEPYPPFGDFVRSVGFALAEERKRARRERNAERAAEAGKRAEELGKLQTEIDQLRGELNTVVALLRDGPNSKAAAALRRRRP